jgi:hypothetical protein
VRDLTAEYANKMHEMASRLQTNEAERRFRERKRATETEDNTMGDVGEDADDWQTPRRRGRTGTSSATVDGGPGGPARTPGTSATPASGNVGSLTAGVAAGLQAAGQATAAAAAGRGQSTSGGDGPS